MPEVSVWAPQAARVRVGVGGPPVAGTMTGEPGGFIDAGESAESPLA